jgi:chemotaxis signal transduction protein
MPVALAPDKIEGLMNLRGQIVTAIDLGRPLPERNATAQPMNVVIRTEAGSVSLLVDEIGEVLDLEDAAHEPATEIWTPPPANWSSEWSSSSANCSWCSTRSRPSILR